MDSIHPSFLLAFLPTPRELGLCLVLTEYSVNVEGLHKKNTHWFKSGRFLGIILFIVKYIILQKYIKMYSLKHNNKVAIHVTTTHIKNLN